MAKKRKTELDIDIAEEEEEEAPPEESEEPPPAEDKEEDAEKEKESKPFIRPVIIKIGAIVLLALIVLSGVGYMVYSHFAEKAQLAKEELKRQEELKKKEEMLAKVPKVPLYPLSPFFVRLKDKGKEDKFLSITITMELTSENVSKELNKFLASIREAIFFYLSGKSSTDLRGKKNMDALESDLKILVNRNLQTGAAKKIYFLEYVIQ